MTYLKINGHDYSMYVNQLKIGKQAIYKSATNAAGNTVVKLVNTKKNFTVGIIPLSAGVMKTLLADIASFTCTLEYLNPETGALTSLNCYIPNNDVEYYTIRSGKTMFKEFTFVVQELWGI